MGSQVGRDNFCRVMLAVSARGGGAHVILHFL